jgi:Protein of unknown function (DUF2806)
MKTDDKPSNSTSQELTALEISAVNTTDVLPTASEALSSWLGFKLPAMPRTITNFDKAGAAFVDWPISWMEGKAARNRSATRRDLKLELAVTAAMSNVIGSEGDRRISGAVRGIVQDYLSKQRNRSYVLQVAAEELRDDPGDCDAPSELSDEFLVSLKGKVDLLSTEQAGTYFGKVLAGEIKRPGSFSKQTLAVLAELDEETGRLFEILCNTSSIGVDPATAAARPRVYTIGTAAAGRNGLAPFGLPFNKLLLLAESRLIAPNIDSSGIFLSSFAIAGREYHLEVRGKPTTEETAVAVKSGTDWINRVEHGAVLFSRAGAELRQIVSLKPNEEYITQLAAGLEAAGITLVRT